MTYILLTLLAIVSGGWLWVKWHKKQGNGGAYPKLVKMLDAYQLSRIPAEKKKLASKIGQFGKTADPLVLRERLSPKQLELFWSIGVEQDAELKKRYAPEPDAPGDH